MSSSRISHQTETKMNSSSGIRLDKSHTVSYKRRSRRRFGFVGRVVTTTGARRDDDKRAVPSDELDAMINSTVAVDNQAQVAGVT